MKTEASRKSAERQHAATSNDSVAGGQPASALTPPAYGIGFVDGAGSGAEPLQLQENATSSEHENGIAVYAHPQANQRPHDFPRPNQTGMPDRLKVGLEQLSGFDLSDVRVHYNSARPAQLNALAYAQGQDIHIGPGQQKHLPHEGWHVVQQMQERVKPTTRVNGALINDDRRLEREADVMGTRAVNLQLRHHLSVTQLEEHNLFDRRTGPVASIDIRKPCGTQCGGETFRDNSKPQSDATKPVVQLTTATVTTNGRSSGKGECKVTERGKGGVSHAEQKSWKESLPSIKNAFEDGANEKVTVEFNVDQTICVACMNWFENSAFKELQKLADKHRKRFELKVTVRGKTITILGQGETSWPAGVGDEMRLSLIEELRDILTTWAGGPTQAQPNTIWIPNESCEPMEYSDQTVTVDQHIRNHEKEIREAKKRRDKHTETGYYLEGKRQKLDMRKVEKEQAELFAKDYEAAHKK
ncbi:MAG: DUF4157 domain-containing protein [Planctomycetaceae bacterium]|nr:DUF4157 domain-containing protein [Planctomycetaceae bacterium]MCB9950057.1 DUF4157 domain-containing protein [Planctomycetaceae bacterium]